MAGIGQPKTGGRQKGVPNRITRELKDMIRGALDQAGGQDYLYQQAQENPNAFLQLVGKILPQELKAKADDGAQVVITLGIGRDND